MTLLLSHQEIALNCR